MKTFLIILGFLIGLNSSAQTIPGVQWSKRFGGDWNDLVQKIVPAGNGWLAVGITGSATGPDIGVTNGGQDVWITYWDYQGRIRWKKNIGLGGGDFFVDFIDNNDGTFLVLANVQTGSQRSIQLFKMSFNNGTILKSMIFGGLVTDIPVDLLKTSENTYVIIGKTTSSELPLFHGGTDIYAIKIKDTLTTFQILWDKCLGGSSTDESFGGGIDASGNINIVGETSSDNGDVSGRHGGVDIWIVNLSQSGNINWQRCYGGSSNDLYGGNVVSTLDGNMVVVSRTYSNNGDVLGSHGLADSWVFKIDQAGNILWQNCLGGNGFEIPFGIDQKNGEIFIASTTTSVNNGNVFGHNGGYQDIWVCKLSINGALVWQRCAGGTKEEDFAKPGLPLYPRKNAVIADADSGCIVLAYSTSLNGNVTGYHGTVASTIQDAWLFKLSGSGSFQWGRCFGGTAAEEIGDVLPLGGANYLLTFATNSTDGDINGNYGGQDAWMARLGAVNHIKGLIYVDANLNGLRDAGEVLYPFDTRLRSVKGLDTTFVSTNTGLYIIERDTGSYNTVVLPGYSYFTPVPSSHNSNFTSYFNIDSTNFGLQPLLGVKDLVVKVIPSGPARPGFNVSYVLIYGNIGTEPINNVQLKFVRDPKLYFLSSTPSQSGLIGDTTFWNFGTIQPYEGFKSVIVNCYVNPPPLTQNGQLIRLISSITPVVTDFTPNNNNDTLKMLLTGSFDPNDKLESHAGQLYYQEILGAAPLTYTIRFQNTGTDTAFKITIRDTLTNKLNIGSFKMIYASHPYTVQLDGNRLTWTFNNINLPDSNRNVAGSQGKVSFTILPQTSLLPGDTIKNSASIYFDYNLPVQTDINNTAIVHDSLVCPGSNTFFRTQLSGDTYQWQVNTGSEFINLTDDMVYSGTGSNVLQITGASTNMNRYKFRCIVTSGATSQYSIEYILRFGVSWNGNVSSAWEDPANWNCGIVPNGSTEVIIFQKSNSPEINFNTSCYNIHLQPYSQLTIKPGVVLSIIGVNDN